VLVGDHENVHGRRGVDVPEGSHIVGPEDLVRGDLIGHDLAEETIAHVYLLS
jgi:hypothetical protein